MHRGPIARLSRLAAGAGFGVLVLAGGVKAQDFPPLENTLPSALVHLGHIDSSILQDIRYAGSNNFTGRPVPGYQSEAGVASGSSTETFVALRVFIDNWRWAGVPFFLRTGKRLPKQSSEIAIHLKEGPPILFNRDPEHPLEANVLTIRIQPDEGFALGIVSKVPGPHVAVHAVDMDFTYSEMFGGTSPEAYERLLLDVMIGDATLFMRRDQVDCAANLRGPRHETEDVAGSCYRQISGRTVRSGAWRIGDVDGKRAARNLDHRTAVQEVRRRPHVERCGHHDDAQIIARTPGLLGQRQRQIRVDTPLMELIDDDGAEI